LTRSITVVLLERLACFFVTNRPLVWIEHRPNEDTGGGPETFELVVFSSYEVEERAPYLGETRAWIGDATWKSLDRATVEALIGQKV
jgi:hypothetical protein